MKPKEKLPRGVRRRPDSDSLYVSFALRDVRCSAGEHIPECECGKIEIRSLGEVSVAYAKEQVAIFRRQVRQGTYQKKQSRKPAPVEIRYTLTEVWLEYLRAYRNAGGKAEWRQAAAWLHLSPVFGTMLPSQLTTAKLSAYQERRQAEGASNATVNRELSALSAALFHAAKVTVEDGKPLLAYVPVFPAKLKESAPRAGFVTDAEYAAALAANANEPSRSAA